MKIKMKMRMKIRSVLGWALPLDPEVRSIHMGDVGELGNLVSARLELAFLMESRNRRS
jgi:hypothetical protein